MRILVVVVASLTTATSVLRAQDLEKFGEESSRFYLSPTRTRFDEFQRRADNLAETLKKRGNGADVMAAVLIAKASQKYHWAITSKGKVSETAREVVNGQSKLASYVANDNAVDPSKLDIWWASFFGTGETTYLSKVLRYAEPPEKLKPATQLVSGATAAWSFKSNCKQHKAVADFAKKCLQTNTFPEKKDFLRECVDASKNGKGS